MPLFKYFSCKVFAERFINKGQMRFGSLNTYRQIEDGGVRGDANDAAAQQRFDPPLVGTWKRDGSTFQVTGKTHQADNMFIYSLSNDRSVELARNFGPYCVEIRSIDFIISKLKARVHQSSRLDYANIRHQNICYSECCVLNDAVWDDPWKLVFVKPQSYSMQNEFRIVLPLKPNFNSSNEFVDLEIGNLQDFTSLHIFDLPETP
jgi:hypothetical protein